MTAMPPTSLEIIIPKIKAGDQEAANILFNLFQNYVYAYGLRWLKNETDAEDLAQNAIMHSIIKIHQLNCSKAYPSWLRRIAYNMAIDVIKARRQDFEINDDSAIEYELEPINNLIKQEDAKTLKKAIRKLKKMDRTMLVEFYFKNKSIEKIAKQEEAPIGTIKRRLFVARNRLRAYYEEMECQTKAHQ